MSSSYNPRPSARMTAARPGTFTVSLLRSVAFPAAPPPHHRLFPLHFHFFPASLPSSSGSVLVASSLPAAMAQPAERNQMEQLRELQNRSMELRRHLTQVRLGGASIAAVALGGVCTSRVSDCCAGVWGRRAGAAGLGAGEGAARASRDADGRQRCLRTRKRSWPCGIRRSSRLPVPAAVRLRGSSSGHGVRCPVLVDWTRHGREQGRQLGCVALELDGLWCLFRVVCIDLHQWLTVRR